MFALEIGGGKHMAKKADVGKKRNPFKLIIMWLVWSFVFRMTAALVLVIGFAAYALAMHMHDHNAMKAATHGFALGAGLTIRISGFAAAVLVRKGLLPGTRKPDSLADLAAVFSDPTPVRARPMAQAALVPAYVAPTSTAPVAPQSFGRRRALVYNPQ